jgi:hypothetical protein
VNAVLPRTIEATNGEENSNRISHRYLLIESNDHASPHGLGINIIFMSSCR